MAIGTNELGQTMDLSGMSGSSINSFMGNGSAAAGALSSALPFVGAGLDILGSIANIYGAYQANKQEEKNRALAEKIYNQQRADEQAKFEFEKGITMQNLGMAKEQHGLSMKTGEYGLVKDKQQRYLDFVKSYTGFINSSPQLRASFVGAYKNM